MNPVGFLGRPEAWAFGESFPDDAGCVLSWKVRVKVSNSHPSSERRYMTFMVSSFVGNLCFFPRLFCAPRGASIHGPKSGTNGEEWLRETAAMQLTKTHRIPRGSRDMPRGAGSGHRPSSRLGRKCPQNFFGAVGVPLRF
jgi:hypothetical protein